METESPLTVFVWTFAELAPHLQRKHAENRASGTSTRTFFVSGNGFYAPFALALMAAWDGGTARIHFVGHGRFFRANLTTKF